MYLHVVKIYIFTFRKQNILSGVSPDAECGHNKPILESDAGTHTRLSKTYFKITIIV